MKRFFWLLHILFFILTLAIYALGHWLLSGHWIAGFLMLSIPFLILTHLFLAIFWFLVKRERMWLSSVAFLLSFPFWARTFQLNGSGDTPSGKKADVTVMNYNVYNFDAYNFLDQKDLATAPNIIQWVQNQDVDVLCFQEYYNLSSSKTFNLTKQLRQKGYRHSAFLHSEQAPNEENFIGVALFSKFPITNKGEKYFQSSNGLVYADIEVNGKMLRVINVHLTSLAVRFDKAKSAYKNNDKEELKSESKFILGKIRGSFKYHTKELVSIEKIIDQSPYPVLLCGDFNETPYGHTYGKLRKKLNNAFEQKGQGFGFSFKNDPKYIRIDNQFFDDKTLEVIDFWTRRDVPYSDHFPLIGRYRFK